MAAPDEARRARDVTSPLYIVQKWHQERGEWVAALQADDLVEAERKAASMRRGYPPDRQDWVRVIRFQIGEKR